MKVIETQDEFQIEFDWNPIIVSEVRKIGGGRWNPVIKRWRFPKHKRAEIEVLKNRFGMIEEGPKVDFREIPDLPELTIDIPLKRPLFPFQSKGVAYSLENKRLIIGDDPGLGKTSQAVATIVAANAFPALIVCPSSLKYNWQEEFEKVAGIKSMILQDSVKHTWPTYYKTGLFKVFITNYESLKK